MNEWCFHTFFLNAGTPYILVSLHMVTSLSVGWGPRLCRKGTVSQRVSQFIHIMVLLCGEECLLCSNSSKAMRGKIVGGGGDIMKERKYAFGKCIWKGKCFSTWN